MLQCFFFVVLQKGLLEYMKMKQKNVWGCRACDDDPMIFQRYFAKGTKATIMLASFLFVVFPYHS